MNGPAADLMFSFPDKWRKLKRVGGAVCNDLVVPHEGM